LIHEKIYIKQPPSYKKKEDNQDFVCKLNKTLYSLKQSPKLWFDILATFLAKFSFQLFLFDNYIFSNSKRIFITTFVNNFQLISSSLDTINKIKTILYTKFQIINLGASSFYLKIKITYDRAYRILKLSQKSYI
jgi:hypothetical protein